MRRSCKLRRDTRTLRRAGENYDYSKLIEVLNLIIKTAINIKEALMLPLTE